MKIVSNRFRFSLAFLIFACSLGSSSAMARPPSDHASDRSFLEPVITTRSHLPASRPCGIDAEGVLQCTLESGHVAQHPPPQGRFLAVSPGQTHACAIRSDGSVICWGRNDGRQLDVPPGLEAVAIWAGDLRSCAITSAGEKRCWGNVDEQPLSRFSWVQGSRIEESTRKALIAAGDSHTCAQDADSRAWCRGDDRLNQLSAPDAPMRTFDVRGDQGCGILFDGTLRCWGNADAGTNPSLQGAFRAIDVGQFNACGVRANGSGACWGWNFNGQGDVPHGIYRRIATGLNHTCGLRDDGRLSCWGYGADGQTSPPEGVFRDIDVGERHSCALRADATLTCWGLGSEGQTAVPVSASGYRKLAIGAFHGCALRGDGGIDCWGRNDRGQTMAPPGRYVSLAVGFAHSCAVRENGKDICWGDNAFGQSAAGVQPSARVFSKADTTPPVITPVITGTLGDNGWYVSDVRLEWIVSDPESAVTIAGGCQDVLLTQDTWPEGNRYECYAYSDGNRSSGIPSIYSLVLKRDATPPTITMTDGFGPAPSGWYTSDVDVFFSCLDPASGVENGCHASHRVTTEGSTVLTHEVRDAAGNVATFVHEVKLDKTPPEIFAVMPNGTLILNTPFDTQLGGSDAMSGMDWSRNFCSPIAMSINIREAVCRVYDIAGNGSSLTSTYATVYAFEGFLAPFDRSDVLYEVQVGRNLPVSWWIRDALGNVLSEKSLGWIEEMEIPCPDLPVVRVDWRGPYARVGERNLPDGSHRLDMGISHSKENKCYRTALNLRDQTERTFYIKVRPLIVRTGGRLRPAVSAASVPLAQPSGDNTEPQRGRFRLLRDRAPRKPR